MKRETFIWILGIGTFAAGFAVMLIGGMPWLATLLCGVSWLAMGGPVALQAVKGFFPRSKKHCHCEGHCHADEHHHGHDHHDHNHHCACGSSHGILDENFLMTIASIGAFILGEVAEGAAVMLFFRIGQWLEEVAEERSRKSVAALAQLRPDTATVLREGKNTVVSPESVAKGETVVVAPGERIPLDGVLLTGTSAVDTSALTGESLPCPVTVGDSVYAGTVNGGGSFTMTVTGTYGESAVARILKLMEEAAERKAPAERFITRFATVYTPVVVGLATVLAIVPPLLVPGATFGEWIYRALHFLVVSCPCALVISVPLSFFAGMGGCARKGVLVKGAGTLETLAKAKIAVFDKTGTLTEAKFGINRMVPTDGTTEEELLRLAVWGEGQSTHPIAVSLREAFGMTPDTAIESEELPGHGMCTTVQGHTILAGNPSLLERYNILLPTLSVAPGEIPVHVACDGVYRGVITLSDRVRDDAVEAVKSLRRLGYRKLVMLTGDRQETGDAVGHLLNLDQVRGGLLPADKVAAVEALLTERRKGETLVMLGDGINDSPVLARADVGVAMGGLGSDAAREAADMVIMDDKPSRLSEAVRISRKTMGIVWENIVFAIGVKSLVMVLATAGIASMWMAVVADVGVMILAVANALRAR